MVEGSFVSTLSCCSILLTQKDKERTGAKMLLYFIRDKKQNDLKN
jgi:hypothetical protein